MSKNMILIVIVFYSFPNLFECTELAGVLADKRMNMNVLKMFDRFFHLRHKDAFFIRNFQKNLTDKYFKSYYGELEMTRPLKADLGMHATYLENTVWYTTSITELFTVLYTKYLAVNYIISFRNCYWYYTYGEKNEEKATKCKKVTTYLYTLMKIAVEDYVKRMEEFIHFIRGGEDTGRPYDFLFDAFSSYFNHITSEMLSPKIPPEVPDSTDEFLRWLLLQEKEYEQRSRLILKYFFRYVFFRIPQKGLEFVEKKEKEEISAFQKKKSKNIHNETAKFWEIVDKLVRRIELRDPRVPDLHIKKGEEKNSGTEKLIQSNFAEIIRKLEIRSLKFRGLDSIDTSKLKSGSEAEVHQFIVEHYSENGFKQHFRFVPLQSEDLERARINVFDNDHLQLSQALIETDFSREAQAENSAETYSGAVFESAAQSAAKSSRTVTGSQFFSNESFMTAKDLSMRSASGAVLTSAELYKSNASMRSSSAQLDESQLKANRAKIETIKREMEKRLSSQQADKSAQNNFSKPSNLGGLAPYMAPDKFGNDSKATGGKSESNYVDVSQSQNVSWGGVRRESPIYFGNISKENRVKKGQLIAGNA